MMYMHSWLSWRVLSTFWYTRDFLPPCEVSAKPSSSLTTPSLVMFAALQRHLLHATQGQTHRKLSCERKTRLGIYLLMLRVTVSCLPQAGCQGHGVLLWRKGGGLLDLLWSLPGIFAVAALLHYDMDSTRRPPNNIGPLQNITSAISVWIHGGGLCLRVWDGAQERVKRHKGGSALKLASE